jgi:uncharacterized membrane protein
MEHEARIVVDRPLSVTYNQWTQFEDFPQFMEGVNRVQQLDDASTEWAVEIAGVEKTFTADIVDQRPDQHIGWRSRTEPIHEGRVDFTQKPDGTEVALWMNFEPEGFVEAAGDKLGFVQRRVEGDLGRFKEFIESREAPTGAWRGTVDDGRTGGPGSSAPVT